MAPPAEIDDDLMASLKVMLQRALPRAHQLYKADYASGSPPAECIFSHLVAAVLCDAASTGGSPMPFLQLCEFIQRLVQVTKMGTRG